MAVVELTRADVSAEPILYTKASAVNVTPRGGTHRNPIAPTGKIGAIHTKIVEAL